MKPPVYSHKHHCSRSGAGMGRVWLCSPSLPFLFFFWFVRGLISLPSLNNSFSLLVSLSSNSPSMNFYSIRLQGGYKYPSLLGYKFLSSDWFFLASGKRLLRCAPLNMLLCQVFLGDCEGIFFLTFCCEMFFLSHPNVMQSFSSCYIFIWYSYSFCPMLIVFFAENHIIWQEKMYSEIFFYRIFSIFCWQMVIFGSAAFSNSP